MTAETADSSTIDLEEKTAPPPAYTNDAPPAYDDIFGKFRKAKDESSGHVDYAWKVVGMICCSTLVTVLVLVIFFTIPIACIVIGAMNLKECTIEKYIPIYLIVAGVFGVIKATLNGVMTCVNKKRKNEEDEDKKNKPNPVEQTINCFLTAWFIAGSVWVYRIYGKVVYDDPTSSMYCDKTAYLFAFWLLTVTYIFMALGLLCCCLMCCVMCCVAAKSDSK